MVGKNVGFRAGDQKMIDEKLTEKASDFTQQEVLSTLKKIEKHLRALVYYNTPEKAFMSSAGKAKIPQSKGETLEEVIAQEIGKYLKEKK
jgi:hypothetical protein